MKLTEAKIKQAQAVIEAVMKGCEFESITFISGQRGEGWRMI